MSTLRTLSHYTDYNGHLHLWIKDRRFSNSGGGGARGRAACHKELSNALTTALERFGTACQQSNGMQMSI